MKLEAKEITFAYKAGASPVLNRVSFCVQSGERVGLTAPSGYGKTTLCRILSGYETPDEGEVRLDGTLLADLKGALAVQMIWQHPEQALNPRLKVEYALKEGNVLNESFIEKLGIKPEWLKRYPSELSGGEMQRFCIARALKDTTKILIADEITSMFDLVTQSEIWRALLEEAERRNLGMVIVSHSESLLKRVCTREIPLLNGGT